MIKHTDQDYVKAILQISMESEACMASTGRLAKRLGVTDGTASKMIRVLSEAGLVDFTAYEGAQLTEKGHQLALRVLRNHRLLELFLSTALNLSWDEVHEEAERLEHVVSDRLIQRIDEFLGHPQIDPHGDPIPQPDGTVPGNSAVALVECTAGSPFVIRRVLDQAPTLLQFLSSVGACPGQCGSVVENSPVAEIVSIALDGKVVSLSRAIASKMLVDVPH